MYCFNCGKPVAETDNFCVNCGTLITKGKNCKWVIALLIVLAFSLAVLVLIITLKENGFFKNMSNSHTSQATEQEKTPSEFISVCPIKVSGKLDENIDGYVKLNCKIENNASKAVAAVKMYFVPKNVYEEEIRSIFSNERFIADNEIDPKSSITGAFDLYEESIKSGDLYVYSVYFSDGTEWGDREASVSEIKKYGYKVVCSF